MSMESIMPAALPATTLPAEGRGREADGFFASVLQAVASSSVLPVVGGESSPTPMAVSVEELPDDVAQAAAELMEKFASLLQGWKPLEGMQLPAAQDDLTSEDWLVVLSQVLARLETFLTQQLLPQGETQGLGLPQEDISELDSSSAMRDVDGFLSTADLGILVDFLQALGQLNRKDSEGLSSLHGFLPAETAAQTIGTQESVLRQLLQQVQDLRVQLALVDPQMLGEGGEHLAQDRQAQEHLAGLAGIPRPVPTPENDLHKKTTRSGTTQQSVTAAIATSVGAVDAGDENRTLEQVLERTLSQTRNPAPSTVAQPAAGTETQGVSAPVTTQIIEIDGKLLEIKETAHTRPGERVEEIRVLRQVAERVQLMVRGPQSSMTMQLQPENLGRVHLRVEMNDGVMRVQIRVETEGARLALENQSGMLREAVESHKITVERMEVFVEKDRSGEREQERQSSGKRRREGRSENKLLVEVPVGRDTGRRLGYNSMEMLG